VGNADPFEAHDFLESATAVLVTRLKSLHCGFGFYPSFINCIGCERDIWRTEASCQRRYTSSAVNPVPRKRRVLLFVVCEKPGPFKTISMQKQIKLRFIRASEISCPNQGYQNFRLKSWQTVSSSKANSTLTASM